MQIKKGDSVPVKIGGVLVHVYVTQVNKDGTFTGNIEGVLNFTSKDVVPDEFSEPYEPKIYKGGPNDYKAIL